MDKKVLIVDDESIIDLKPTDLVKESLLGSDLTKLDNASKSLVYEYKKQGLTPEEIHVRLYRRSIRLAEKNYLRGKKVR